MNCKKVLCIVALFLAVLVSIVPHSFTAAAFSQDSGSITIQLAEGLTDEAIFTVPFRLYQVAKVYQNQNGVDFRLVSPYDSANVKVEDLQDATSAVHLAYFAQSRNLPYQEVSTNQEGTAVFHSLDLGLYLAVPMIRETDEFSVAPFMVYLPTYDSVNQTYNYNVTAYPKTYRVNDTQEDTTYLRVSKKWDTIGEHPDSVTAVLLRDLQEYETVELNEGNNWQYQWENLSKNHVWNVVEKQVPNGYTVRYTTTSNTVTIINQSDDPNEDPPPDPGDDDELVQTGQLNWPVPICAIAGLLLFSLGWALLNLGVKNKQ